MAVLGALLAVRDDSDAAVLLPLLTALAPRILDGAPPWRALVVARLLVAGAALLVAALWRLAARRWRVVAESVMVVGGLGVQLSTVYADGREEVLRFVDAARVDSFVINEAIQRQRVVAYIVLLVGKQDSGGGGGGAADGARGSKRRRPRRRRGAASLESDLTIAIGRELRPPLRLLTEMFQILHEATEGGWSLVPPHGDGEDMTAEKRMGRRREGSFI